MKNKQKQPHDFNAFLAKEQAAWLKPMAQHALFQLANDLGFDNVVTRKANEIEDRAGIDCFILPTDQVHPPISVQIKYIFHPSGNYPLELGCDTQGITPWAMDASNKSQLILFVNMNTGGWVAVDTQDLVSMCKKSGHILAQSFGQRAIENELNGVMWTNYITLLTRDQLIWLLKQHEAFFLTSAENRER
jgi:hypothetical protein